MKGKDMTGHSIIAEQQDHAGNTIVWSVYVAFIGGVVIGVLLTLIILEMLK